METVKKALLISFVLAGVVLIVLIWVQGLNVTETSGVVYQPTQALNNSLASTQTPTPYSTPAGTNSPDQQPGDQTATPMPGQAQQNNPTQTPNVTQTWVAQGYNE
jgi:hypothetical protein